MDCVSAETYLDSYYKNAYGSLDLNHFFSESTIYTRKCPIADHYEYVATYVDDFA